MRSMTPDRLARAAEYEMRADENLAAANEADCPLTLSLALKSNAASLRAAAAQLRDRASAQMSVPSSARKATAISDATIVAATGGPMSSSPAPPAAPTAAEIAAAREAEIEAVAGRIVGGGSVTILSSGDTKIDEIARRIAEA